MKLHTYIHIYIHNYAYKATYIISGNKNNN